MKIIIKLNLILIRKKKKNLDYDVSQSDIEENIIDDNNSKFV